MDVKKVLSVWRNVMDQFLVVTFGVIKAVKTKGLDVKAPEKIQVKIALYGVFASALLILSSAKGLGPFNSVWYQLHKFKMFHVLV